MRVVGEQELRPLARSKALAAVVAAAALIGCSGAGTRAPATDITGSLAPSRAATNALRIDWTLSRECVVGGVEAGAIKGVSSSTAATETHGLRGTGGTVTFSADAFRTEGATVSLTCGDTTVVEETIAAPAITGNAPPPNTGSLALSRGGDYNVTAAWSFPRTCARSPQLRATAAGSTPDIFALTGTSGSENLRNVHYRNVAATVELRCDGETLATETIAAPAGSLTLTRGNGNSLHVAWTLNPSCSAGEIAATPASPADGSAGDSRTISGTGGSIEFTDRKYKSQGAGVTLDCNGARMATETIAAPATTVRGPPPPPAITGTLTLRRGGDYHVTAAWSLSRTCDRNPRVRATAGGSTAETFDLTGTSGTESLSTAKYRNVAANVELRCAGVVLAKETIAAPAGTLTLTRGNGNSLEVAWILNPSCSTGEIAATPADGSAGDSRTISGTGGSVEFTDSKYKSQGAGVTLDCTGVRMARETIAAPAGTLTLSRGADYNVTAAWSLSRTCDRNPRVRATAGGSTADTFDLTGTSGSESLSTAKYRNVAANVELRCAGVVVAKETIAAPAGSLTLTRGSADSVKVAWTLNPSCAAGKVTTSPAGETQTHDFAISGSSGNVETTATAYTTKAADVKLKCNAAEITTATIDAPATGTLTLTRRSDNVIRADWTVSRLCSDNGRIAGVTAATSHTASAGLWGNYGVARFLGPYFETEATTVTLSCEGKTLAEKTIAAP